MSEGTVVRIKIEEVVYEIDVSNMTFGEVELLEREVGAALGKIDFESITAILALAWIARRRKEPMLSMDDLRVLPMSAIEVMDDVDPSVDVVDGEDSTEGITGSPSLESAGE